MAETTTPSLDLSSLSPKQQDMAMARSPATGQEMNALNMERTAQNRQLDEQRKGIASRKIAEQQGRVSPAGQQGQAGGQATGQMQRNLSSFSNRIAAKMNQFASGGDVSKLAMDLPAELKPTWDEATQSFTIPDIADIGYDVSDIAKTKAEQIQAMQDAYSPYFEYNKIGDRTQVMAKSFSDTLKQFADLDNDGQISPQEQKYLDESFQIAEMLQRLEKLNPNSAEAEALRMQLEMLDDEGLVSGIDRALQQYKGIVGEEGKGPTMYGGLGQDEIDLEDIVNMSNADLEKELMKALTGQESFFGGDFATALNSNRLRTNLEKSLEFDTRTRTEMARAATEWSEGLDNTFQTYRDRINEGFKSVAEEKIPAYFEQVRGELISRGEDTASLDAAMQWFDDISSGEQDAATAIWELLNDEETGLALDQKKVIADWIGQTTGDAGASTAGILSGVLDSLAQKGYVEVSRTNDKGEPENIVVEFSDNDRLKVAQIMGNDNMSNEQKSYAINHLVGQKIRERIGAVGDYNKVADYFAEGNFDAGLDAFAESLVRSLNTFNQSATQHLYNKVMETRSSEFTEDMPEGGDARDYVDPEMVESVQAAAQDLATNIENQANLLVENSLKGLDAKKQRATADLAELNRIEGLLSRSVVDGVRRAKTQIDLAMTEQGYDAYAQQILRGLRGQIERNGWNMAMYDWDQLDDVVRAYTLAKNAQFLATQGDAATQKAIKESKFYQNGISIIRDPLAWMKRINLIGEDGVNRWAVSSARNFMNRFERELDGISKNIFDGSGYNTAVQNKLKSIDAAREDATKLLKEADEYEATVRAYASNAEKVLSDLRVFNPNEVAQLAMKMGRAAEMGFTDPVQFLDLSKTNFSKDDFERIASGELNAQPFYKGSAVQELKGGYDYTSLRNMKEDTKLRDWSERMSLSGGPVDTLGPLHPGKLEVNTDGFYQPGRTAEPQAQFNIGGTAAGTADFGLGGYQTVSGRPLSRNA